MIMADYRRLISYIYEYEGKQKGKNVGFAKLEARNGQCRINVNVKRIYMGGNAIGAYLLGTGGRETFLGNVFVRGGNGEFRANVDTKNVEGTGTGLDTYFGLSVHDVKNSWRCYKTIWEDALAAEEGNTGENPVLSVPPRLIRTYFFPRARATDLAMEVLPVPGGPTRQRIGLVPFFVRARTARNSSTRSLTFSRP